MKSVKWFGMSLAACLLMSTVAWAAEKAEQPVVFKAGDISFTILKSDGETPVDGAKIKLSRSAKSKVLAEAVANKDGQAVIPMENGKYFLKVEGRNISEMNVAADGTIAECRVVLDDDKAGLVVAGGAGAAAAGAAAAGTGAAAAGTGAAVAAGTAATASQLTRRRSVLEPSQRWLWVVRRLWWRRAVVMRSMTITNRHLVPIRAICNLGRGRSSS